MDLKEVLAAFERLSPQEQKAVAADAMAATKGLLWVPNPGPQSEAFFCEADELFFGGQAGGGKSDLGIGLALTNHERALLLREYNEDARSLGERMLSILGSTAGWNGQLLRYKDAKRLIEFGGCQYEEDKQRYKGDPHDLIVFDEVTDFTETQYVFISTWNRSATPGQRSRVVATGNPPTRAKGMWVIRRWAAWLDPAHPRPAKPGELRWYTSDGEGREIEVDGPGPHEIDGRTVVARSRTFIPSALSDNPDLAATNYGAMLDSLPKELRAAYRDGSFGASLEDDQWQAIPTSWILAAVARWTPTPPVGIPMCSIGVDVAQGGADNTVIARRHDGWYAPLIVTPGKETPGGTDVAGLVISKRRDNAKVIVDVGGGWGGDAHGHLMRNGVDSVPYMGVKPSHKRTADNQLTFGNIRSEATWRFREALNPDQPGGSRIALPDDRELIADLAAPTYEVRANGIHVEPKDKLIKRIGRSPDRGDAVVMAWWAGARMSSDWHSWPASQGNARHVPKVIMGRQPLTARR